MNDQALVETEEGRASANGGDSIGSPIDADDVNRGSPSWPIFAALAGQIAVTLLALGTVFWGGRVTLFAWLAYPVVVGALAAGCKSCGISALLWMLGAPVVSVVIFVVAFYFWTGGADFRGDSLDSTDRSVVGVFGVIFVAGATFFASMIGVAIGWVGSEIAYAVGKARPHK